MSVQGDEDPFWNVELGHTNWSGDGKVEWVVPDDEEELCMLELRRREFISHCTLSGNAADGTADSDLWRTARLEAEGGDAAEDGEFNGFVGSVEVFSFENVKAEKRNESVGSTEPVQVKIRALDGDGVLCDVGGEVWEASICMSCWLLQQQQQQQQQLGVSDSLSTDGLDWDWRQKRVLELGAGLGLCGLALAKGVAGVRVALTDFDDTLLCNLLHNARINVTDADEGGGNSGTNEGEAGGIVRVGAGVEVARLDWADRAFVDTDDASDASEKCTSGSSSNSIVDEKFDYLVGSELVYAPHHAVMLASVIGQ
jgi:hypothetical protein